MTPKVLVSYLDRMLVSSEGVSAEGAELEIPYRKENAQALVLHQWALWALRPSPIPKEMKIIWAWTQQPLPVTTHSPMGLGSHGTIILEASVKAGLAWPPRRRSSDIGGR